MTTATPARPCPRVYWRVAPAGSGRFAAFERRSWPMGYSQHRDGSILIQIRCEDSYRPIYARGVNPDSPLRVYLADWRERTSDGRVTFVWRKLRNEAASLADAKAMAEHALTRHPELWPPLDM